MTNSVFASIIVPAFNAAATIEQTLDCLLRQTHSSMEVVVVDDGSTDDTAERVQTVIGTHGDPRIRLVRRPGQGLDAIREAGSSLARGQFVAFCEPGDFWGPAKLEMYIDRRETLPGSGLGAHGSAANDVDLRQRQDLGGAMSASQARGDRSAVRGREASTGARWLGATMGRRDRARRAAR